MHISASLPRMGFRPGRVNPLVAWPWKTRAVVALYLLVACSTGAASDDCEESLDQQQELIYSVLEKATPAVVAIRLHDGCDSSGVIVSKTGLVLTHGHHASSVMQENCERNRQLPVALSDGRRVSARMVATYHSYRTGAEYSLLKITAGGEWPHVEIAPGSCPQRGDWCLHLGRPFSCEENHPPVPRLGRIVAANEVIIASSCMTVAGDSGGPLLDREGRVLGITSGSWGSRCHRPSHYTNVAVLRSDLFYLEQYDVKRNVREVCAKLVEPRPPSHLYRALAEDARQVTVQVCCDGAPRVLGTIVNREGYVVTKRSELTGRLSCQLQDGRRVSARLVADARDHDVSLLRLDDPPAVDPAWCREGRCVRGTIVASIGMTPDPVAIGIVSDARVQSISADPGSLHLQIEASENGLYIKEVGNTSIPYAKTNLRPGDQLISIEGHKFTTLEDYRGFWNRKQNPPCTGERISLHVRRHGKSLTMSAQCSPAGYDLFRELDEAGELSPRRSGFPEVIVHDSVLAPEHCGGPVVDISGKIFGINIARAGRHATYAIPSTSVLELTRRLSSLRQ